MPPQHRKPNVQWDLVRSEFEDLLDVEESEIEDAIFDSILEGQVEVSKSFDKADAYAKRIGASMSSNPEGHCFVNGKHFEMSEVKGIRMLCQLHRLTSFQTFLRSMQMEVTRQIQHLQEQVLFFFLAVVPSVAHDVCSYTKENSQTTIAVPCQRTFTTSPRRRKRGTGSSFLQMRSEACAYTTFLNYLPARASTSVPVLSYILVGDALFSLSIRLRVVLQLRAKHPLRSLSSLISTPRKGSNS